MMPIYVKLFITYLTLSMAIGFGLMIYTSMNAFSPAWAVRAVDYTILPPIIIIGTSLIIIVLGVMWGVIQ